MKLKSAICAAAIMLLICVKLFQQRGNIYKVRSFYADVWQMCGMVPFLHPRRSLPGDMPTVRDASVMR